MQARVRLSDAARRVTKTRTNTMVYNNIRPAIYVSKTGEPGSFKCWNKQYNIIKELNDQIDISRQSEVFVCDIEKCIASNLDSFVGMVGYDSYEYIDSFFMVHKPPMVCDVPIPDTHSHAYNTTGLIQDIPISYGEEFQQPEV